MDKSSNSSLCRAIRFDAPLLFFLYRNNKDTSDIDIHPEKAVIAKYVFEQYATGRFSDVLQRGVR